MERIKSFTSIVPVEVPLTREAKRSSVKTTSMVAVLVLAPGVVLIFVKLTV